jgi:hypothetical protein
VRAIRIEPALEHPEVRHQLIHRSVPILTGAQNAGRMHGREHERRERRTTRISASSQGRQAWISRAFGF